MRHVTKGLILFLPITLLMTGCERRVVRGDYFPMRDGNRWTYRFLHAELLQRLARGENISVAASPDTKTAAPAETSSRKAEVLPFDDPAPPDLNALPTNAREARTIELTLKERSDELTYKATLSGAEQVWSKRDGYVGFQNASGRHYWLILPPHSGYRWIVTDANGENLYYEIVGHEPLTTPAGTFQSCAVVRQESRDRRVIFKLWFGDGVGLIRRSKYYVDEEIFRQELIDFKIRPSSPAGRRAEEQEIQRALKGTRRGKEFYRQGKAKSEAQEPETQK